MSQNRDYSHGLPGYHDVLAKKMDAPSALSALTLRLWLAGFGLVFCALSATLLFVLVPGLTWFAWVLVAFAVVAAVDFGWVAHRKRRGEPG